MDSRLERAVSTHSLTLKHLQGGGSWVETKCMRRNKPGDGGKACDGLFLREAECLLSWDAAEYKGFAALGANHWHANTSSERLSPRSRSGGIIPGWSVVQTVFTNICITF